MKIKDLQTGNEHEYGSNSHDSLTITEDGRSLTYYNLHNGDGSRFGDYRFCTDYDDDNDVPYWNIGGFGNRTVSKIEKDDLISRQAAIDAAIRESTTDGAYGYVDTKSLVDLLKALPPAQPEYRLDEWCTDCKEYDQEHHCCPRYNRVIREALKDARPTCTETEIQKIQEMEQAEIDKAYQLGYEEGKKDAQPKRKTGK